MADDLWSWPELSAAAQGSVDGAPVAGITGFSLDSRSLGAGEIFVALKDQRDGHEFVTAAFGRGAAGALVSTAYQRKPDDGPLIRVDDPLRGLERIGKAARSRLRTSARVVAITGSAGKTGTTAMLRACLASTGGQVHAPEKSFNNHWGVPLTLARMPAATDFAVIEIGMNHAGEISPLTRLVRPHVAVITNVLPVHVGNFPDGEVGVANAKAEIFDGLEPGGVAILPRDNPHFERLSDAAGRRGARILGFGLGASADFRPGSLTVTPNGTDVSLTCGGSYRLGIAGEHIAVNSLAVAAALSALRDVFGCAIDVVAALRALAEVAATAGRGERRRCLIKAAGGEGGDAVTLIDESYNANPASMRAALAVLGRTEPAGEGRRIAVMGDMRELGEAGPSLHRSLADAVASNGVEAVFTCGPLMRNLYEAIDASRRGAWGEQSGDLIAPLFAALRPGDVVMVKGSLGTNMAPIIREFARRDRDFRAMVSSASGKV